MLIKHPTQADRILKSPQLLSPPKPFVALPEGKLLTWNIPCFSKPAKPVTSLKDTQQVFISYNIISIHSNFS